MKQRIYHLSPHRNGLVAGVMSAVMALVFVVPMFVVMMIAMPAAAKGDEAFPIWMLIVMPIFYFVLGYLMTALACFVYNLLFGKNGGIEFELRAQHTDV